jgi:hypothetical protein
MEELLNEKVEQVADEEITKATASTSPFIKKMNEKKDNAQQQLSVLEQFLNKVQLHKTFYTELSKMALNKVNPQAANPAQPKANAQAPAQAPAGMQK